MVTVVASQATTASLPQVGDDIIGPVWVGRCPPRVSWSSASVRIRCSGQ